WAVEFAGLIAASLCGIALAHVLGEGFVKRLPVARMLAQVLIVHALGSVGLLFVPVGVVDAILPIFLGGFFLVPIINVVIRAFADYYAAALACAAIDHRYLVDAQAS